MSATNGPGAGACLAAGIHYNVPAATYHADPAPVPSLSSGIARKLLSQTPRHAWFAHPRLNEAHEPDEPTDAMEAGSILHRLVLGAGQEIAEVEADSWRAKAAQQQRDEAREAGAIPVLTHKLAELERVADAAREQIAAHHEIAGALDLGSPEVALIWRDGRSWGRALVDWLRPEPEAPLYDLKFTGKSAAPQDWERSLIADYAIQEALYLRGARALGLRPPGMRFVVCETKPPYGLCVYQSAPSLLAAAEADVEEALARWQRCLATDRWPGYPPFVCHVEAPAWRLMRGEERRDHAAQIAQLTQEQAA